MDSAKIVSVFDGMSYKLGSLFDGSGGFPLAGSLCGIKPCWAAEVEPYPIAVTRSRFPNMKHLGDISKVHGGEIEPVDIITFGSPCQDLSVAGKRAGLKHEANGDDETTRSGLFMEAVRIIKEMRKATGGQFPRFALWENVPGAFSSQKGEDFRVVLEDLIRIVEPGASVPPVPKAGWAYADHFRGDGWSLAWRVFDARYWGVPQRRRRIHLVVDFRGECAGEVLFEREGVRGYFAEGRTPWQAAPGDAQDRSGADDREGESAGGLLCPSSAGYADGLLNGRGRQLDAVGFDVYNMADTGAVAKTLSAAATDADHVPVVYGIDHAITTGGNCTAQVPCVYEDIQATLKASGPHAVAYTLKIRSGCEGGGKGALVQEDKSATLATNNDQYLFQPMSLKEENWAESGVKNALRAGESKVSHCIVDRHAVAYSIENHPADSRVNIDESGKVQTLTSRMGTGGGNVPMVMARDWKSPTCAAVRYIVRRLTPTECARLQGFPDRWGDIDHKDSFTPEEFHFWHEVRNTHARINGKKVQDYTEAQMLTWYNKLPTDSAEYRMWGNGIALPPAIFCMEGIVDAMDKEIGNEG